MNREFICILCPNGCEIQVKLDSDETILSIEGASCPRGGEYVQQELYAPQRNIASSVKVKGGNMPLASVRLSAAIPKERIFDVMAEIKKVKVEAPVTIGQVIMKDILGLPCDLIATKNVDRI